MRQPDAYGDCDCHFHSDRDGDADGHIYAYRNGYTNGHSNAYSYGNPYGYGHSNRDRIAKGYTDAKAAAHTAAASGQLLFGQS